MYSTLCNRKLYFNYNHNERNKEVGVNFTYAQLFPWIRIGSNLSSWTGHSVTITKRLYFNEWNSYAGLTVPLNFSKGRLLRSLNMGADIAYKKQYVQGIL